MAASRRGEISEFARELLRTDSLKVDGVLQEIRYVLTGLQTSVIDTGDQVEAHWCDPELNCNNVCERARALLSKLTVPSEAGKDR